MTLSDDPSDSRLDRAIAHYVISLEAIKGAAPTPSLEQVIAVLMARDAVEKIRQTTEVPKEKSLAILIQCDKELKDQGKIQIPQTQLANCRQSMRPSESAWWWYLEPPLPPSPCWNRFDWCWNFLTVICLVVAGTFATNTAQAFSTSGFDLLGTFSTLTQGAGLVLIAGGTLTDKGQKAVERILSSLKLPTRLHAEVTFVVAGILLLASYTINRHLPWVGEYYYHQGQEAEVDSQWLVAQDKYERALKFIPSASKVQIGLGKVYERLGQLPEAQTHYESGVLANDIEARIQLGQAKLLQVLQTVRWTGKVEPDQQDQLSSAEIDLELAERSLADERNRNITHIEQLSNRQIQTQGLLVDVYINQGILLWAKVGLEAPDNAAKDELLEQAEALFAKAADLEYYLPTVATGRRADCYQKIAIYINSQVQTKNHQQSNDNTQQIQQEAEGCSASISWLPNHDLYDVLLMSSVLKAKLEMAESEHQSQ